MPPASTHGDDFRVRVMIVDDLASIRALLRDALPRSGALVAEEASNGADALSILRARATCELVIADWGMERMSGLELLREIRADASLKHLPVVIMSADGNGENAAAARKAGASSFLSKPFDSADLQRAISEALVSTR